jgi:small conductance mechanosensitive channel
VRWRAYLGLGRARSAATFVSVILYGIVIVLAITGAGFDLSGLLVGGALTGVIVGIAAQASLSNIIAGVVILFARPYSAGMYLTVRTGTFGGVEYSGQVWDVGLFYTTLHSGGKEIRIPNSTMVTAVVVLRPQQLDVYIPITLPRSTDLSACLERLQCTIESCTVARSAAQVALESVTEAGYVVGVRVFVASEAEQRAVEQAIAAIARQEQDAQAHLTAATP